MTALAIAILYCVTLLAILYRAEPLVSRLVAIAERKADLAAQPTPRQEAVSIPRDLYAVATSYQDEWAREQALQSMREMFAESGSWDMVRVRYGIAEEGGER